MNMHRFTMNMHKRLNGHSPVALRKNKAPGIPGATTTLYYVHYFQLHSFLPFPIWENSLTFFFTFT